MTYEAACLFQPKDGYWGNDNIEHANTLPDLANQIHRRMSAVPPDSTHPLRVIFMAAKVDLKNGQDPKQIEAALSAALPAAKL